MTKHLINYCPIDWYEDELKRKGMTLADLVQHLVRICAAKLTLQLRYSTRFALVFLLLKAY